MSDAPLRVAVVGAAGRMGTFACARFEEDAHFELVARIGHEPLTAGRLNGAEVAVDLTRAGSGAENGHALLELGARIVIGTSGVTEREVGELDAHARELGLGGVVVPNFSVGAVLLARLAREAAAHLDEVLVLEEHHPAKVDAPSQTALAIARGVVEARRAAGHPAPDEVPIHSLRQSGCLANHEVRFGMPGEILRLRHETSDRAAFGPGLLLAVRHARTATGVTEGLEPLLLQRANGADGKPGQ